MNKAFELFLKAVAKNDLGGLLGLLPRHPGLVQAKAEAPKLMPVHWVYAGDSALHVVAAWHRARMVKSLLSRGADPKALNRRGAGPLHYAADGQPGAPNWEPRLQAETIRLLVRAGALPDLQDKNGAAALHRAVRTRCSDAVKALLAAGADKKARNRSGSTPLDLARVQSGRGGSGSPQAKKEQKVILRLLR
jgi:hypothetical protein